MNQVLTRVLSLYKRRSSISGSNSFTLFQSDDVVRHPLVQRIVTAYERRSRNEQAGS